VETQASAPASGAWREDGLRSALVIATLCRYPGLVAEFEADIERLAPENPGETALPEHLSSSTARDAERLDGELAARAPARPSKPSGGRVRCACRRTRLRAERPRARAKPRRPPKTRPPCRALEALMEARAWKKKSRWMP